MCDHVLPVLSDVQAPDDSTEEKETNGTQSAEHKQASQELQLDILKLFADLCTHCGQIEEADDRISNVYNKLLVCKAKKLIFCFSGTAVSKIIYCISVFTLTNYQYIVNFQYNLAVVCCHFVC